MQDPTAVPPAMGAPDKPRAIIHPDDDSVSIVYRGDCVILVGAPIMREIRDSLTGHINYIEAQQNESVQAAGVYLVDIRTRMRALMNIGRDYATALNQAIEEVTAGANYVRCDRCTAFTGEPRKSDRANEIVICAICASPVSWEGVYGES